MTPNSSNNKDLHFKGQYADEHIVAFFRGHWITLVPHILVYGFFLAAIIAVFSFFSGTIIPFFVSPIGQFLLPVFVLLVTYGIHNFFIKLINHFLSIVIITNLRIIEVQKMIFIKDLQNSLDMGVIQDIKKEQNGFWKNILNFGELLIMLSSSDIQAIKFVPNPNFHFRLINRAKIEWQQKQAHQNANQQRNHQEILPENTTIASTHVRHQLQDQHLRQK